MKTTLIRMRVRSEQRADIRPQFLIGLAAVAAMITVAVVMFRQSFGTTPPDTSTSSAVVETATVSQVSSSIPATNVPAAEEQKKSELPQTQRGLSEPELIKILGDPRNDQKDRRNAARLLARLNSSKSLAALKDALKNGPSGLKQAVAESLGKCPNPEARPLLRELLTSTDEATVQGAIRGWATVNDQESVQLLSDLLLASEKSANIRSEAALALGEMSSQPGAYATLTNAAWSLRDGETATSVLEGLGKRPLEETLGFFETYLATPGLNKDLRLAAIEALGNASGDPTSLLIQCAKDSDPDVRAGAAWALSSTETEGKLGSQILQMLQSETEPEVRLRLYQALGNQEAFDANAVMQLYQQETQMDVRIGALDLLAQTCQGQATPEVLAFFNETGIPALTETAVSGESAYDRLTAVQALQQARTPQAIGALEQIARRSSDPKIIEAAGKAIKTSLNK